MNLIMWLFTAWTKTLSVLSQTQYKTLAADQLHTNWTPVLANMGLLLATSVQCLTTMLAAFRFYRLVQLTVAGERRQVVWPGAGHRTPSCCSSSVGSRQKLVQKWLVQQTPAPLERMPVHPVRDDKLVSATDSVCSFFMCSFINRRVSELGKPF